VAKKYPRVDIMNKDSPVFKEFIVAVDKLSNQDRTVHIVVFTCGIICCMISCFLKEKGAKKFRGSGTTVVPVGDDSEKSWDETHAMERKYKNLVRDSRLTPLPFRDIKKAFVTKSRDKDRYPNFFDGIVSVTFTLSCLQPEV